MPFIHVLMVAAAAVLSSASQLPQAQTPPGTGQPPCAVSTDEKYAFTPEQPVQVGGSPLYGAARQRRYLDALRGPEGQRVQYKRTGQHRAPDGTILDAYELTYEGLEKPARIFLDWYHFNPQLAPRGFVCGQPIGLGLPTVSGFQEMDDLQAIALTQGASRDFQPIPLGADGSTIHGVMFDRFRLLALGSRSAAAKGGQLDQQRIRELTQMGMVILAYPLTCERTVRPSAIDIVGANGAVIPASAQKPLSAEDLVRLLPGVAVPAGTIAIAVPNLMAPRPTDTIQITYPETACAAATSQVLLPVKFTPARGVEMPAPALPAGATATRPVLLQVLVDTDGTMQRATYVGGQPELVAAATEAVGRWKSDPARVNGAPMPTGVMLQVRFAPPR